MAEAFTDEMLDAYTVTSTWDGLADAIVDRYTGSPTASSATSPRPPGLRTRSRRRSGRRSPGRSRLLEPLVRPARRDELEKLQQIERAAGRLFAEIGMPEIAADEPASVDELRNYTDRRPSLGPRRRRPTSRSGTCSSTSSTGAPTSNRCRCIPTTTGRVMGAASSTTSPTGHGSGGCRRSRSRRSGTCPGTRRTTSAAVSGR